VGVWERKWKRKRVSIERNKRNVATVVRGIATFVDHLTETGPGDEAPGQD